VAIVESAFPADDLLVGIAAHQLVEFPGPIRSI